MLPSAMTIQPNLARSSVMKMRRRRSSRSETGTCATNLVSELLEVLDDRERKIILMRFGLEGGKPEILEEIGKKFGVTRELAGLKAARARGRVGRITNGPTRSSERTRQAGSI